MHRARETKMHRAHWSWVEEMGGGGGRRTGQDRDAECVVVARPLTRENARMSRTREAQLCAIRVHAHPTVVGQGRARDLKAVRTALFGVQMAASMRCVDPSLTGGPFWRRGSTGAEGRGEERRALVNWQEKIKNHIEMKTKKRTRSWPSRGRHIYGRVVMVAIAGEWVPVGGRALP
ncbi:hypothetical protein F5148DRAFT_1369026 [Russula earlei]|uniref:Uncharacterized protein n=1 Tax=Russula earlei TaxID=71964 RepID=A0ACC0U3X8_9AGAM|nr:hypothetical protein F5148DRAFT_1369026 [Russula earlei]